MNSCGQARKRIRRALKPWVVRLAVSGWWRNPDHKQHVDVAGEDSFTPIRNGNSLPCERFPSAGTTVLG